MCIRDRQGVAHQADEGRIARQAVEGYHEVVARLGHGPDVYKRQDLEGDEGHAEKHRNHHLTRDGAALACELNVAQTAGFL